MAKVCRRTGKQNHRSEGAARAALARIAAEPPSTKRRHVKVETDFYKCLFCPYWHLTSQPQNQKRTEGAA